MYSNWFIFQGTFFKSSFRLFFFRFMKGCTLHTCFSLAYCGYHFTSKKVSFQFVFLSRLCGFVLSNRNQYFVFFFISFYAGLINNLFICIFFFVCFFKRKEDTQDQITKVNFLNHITTSIALFDVH